MLTHKTIQNEQPIHIVGGGLAGSLLAWALIEKGRNVHIYADEQSCASRMAAGLINPVTGQRFVLAEHTPEMLSFARAFYQHIEQQLNIQCFHPKTMKRLFFSQKEQENCQKRFKDAKYRPFLKPNNVPNQLNAIYSGITQQHTAWLDTNRLLDALHNFFALQKCISYRKFLGTDNQSYVIYCEGFKMMFNPLFSWLPMQPAHGEIITCTTDKKLPDYIINQNKWLLPTSTLECRIGATYEQNILEPTIQQASKVQLLAFAQKLFKEPRTFSPIKHQAGIRPTTKDKQPFIGFHPKHQHIAIFNGFGSRGSLMIPWYAQAFSQTLLHGQVLPNAANISRYNQLCD